MNWHHWHWWTWPAAIAFGFAWSFVLMCVIPPRQPVRDYLRGWKTLALAIFRKRNAPAPETTEQT